MTIPRYIKLGFLHQISRWRWLMPILAGFFLAFLSADRLQVELLNSGESQDHLNRWDLLLTVLGNPYYVLYFLIPLFLFLANDLFAPSALDEAILLRLGSRFKWWMTKAIILMLIATLFILSITLMVTAWAFTSFRDLSGWSQHAQESMELTPILLTMRPEPTLGWIIILLILGHYSLGLLSGFVTLCIQNAYGGFVTAMLVLLAGIISYHAGVTAPLSLTLPDTHLLFLLSVQNKGLALWPIPLSSLLYWAAWILVLMLVTHRKVSRMDIILRPEAI